MGCSHWLECGSVLPMVVCPNRAGDLISLLAFIHCCNIIIGIDFALL